MVWGYFKQLPGLIALLASLPAQAGLFDKPYPRGGCGESVFVRNGDLYALDVAAEAPVRTLQGSYFGFNIEWVEFQLSFWDGAQVRQGVLDALKAFPDAVYRYPGGNGANRVDWREASKPLGSRVRSVRGGWTPPMAVEFGPREYLDFVSATGGKAWYVANLYGRDSGEVSPAQLATEAGELAGWLAGIRSATGAGVFRWELGNELDRNDIRWMPAKYAGIAKQVATAIKKADPAAWLVVPQQEFPSLYKQGVSQKEYNVAMMNALPPAADLSAHIYFDEGSDIMLLPRKLSALCVMLEDARSTRPAAAQQWWISEMASAPHGIWEGNSRKVWGKTGNLESAISTADFYIALAQIPEVKGAFLHALHATDGPWALFHRSLSGGLSASVLFHAVRMLRESMLPVVLGSQSVSRNAGGYGGGYDFRAVMMRDAASRRYSLWAVNRAHEEIETSVRMPALKNQRVAARTVVLADAQLEANNIAAPDRLSPRSVETVIAFDAAGEARLRIPGNAVYTLQFGLAGER